MHACGDAAEGVRLRGLIVVLWRAGLRVSEALALAESDLDARRRAILVRLGKGGKRREVGMDRWAWEQLAPWITLRSTLPVGALFCILRGPTIGRPWAPAGVRRQLHAAAARAGVRRRFAPHQLRHAHAVEMSREGVPAACDSASARARGPCHYLCVSPRHRQHRDRPHPPRTPSAEGPRSKPTLQPARRRRKARRSSLTLASQRRPQLVEPSARHRTGHLAERRTRERPRRATSVSSRGCRKMGCCLAGLRAGHGHAVRQHRNAQGSRSCHPAAGHLPSRNRSAEISAAPTSVPPEPCRPNDARSPKERRDSRRLEHKRRRIKSAAGPSRLRPGCVRQSASSPSRGTRQSGRSGAPRPIWKRRTPRIGDRRLPH